jgi:hypothetical protein
MIRNLLTFIALASIAADGWTKAIVLYEQDVAPVSVTLPDANDLWVRPADLPAVNGFELKPEGACIDDICVPVRQDQDSDLFVRRGGEAWFNVTGLADRLQQPYIVDHDQGVWSFGAIPARRSAFIQKGIAPDFALNDIDGNTLQLSDFKGKKVMLLSWASW